MATTNFNAFPLLKDKYANGDKKPNTEGSKSLKAGYSAMSNAGDDKSKYFKNVKKFMQEYNKGPHKGVR